MNDTVSSVGNGVWNQVPLSPADENKNNTSFPKGNGKMFKFSVRHIKPFSDTFTRY